MILNLKIKNKLNIKFLILIFIYLIFFYFFIFKSLVSYMNLKEYIISADTKNKRLLVENSQLKEVLKIKKELFQKQRENWQKKKNNLNEKQSFTSFSEALNFLNKIMENNNISFKSVARSQKNVDTISISINFLADEKDTLNFFYDLENSEYFFNLSNKYFKIFMDEKLSSKLTIDFKISDNTEQELSVAFIKKESEAIFKNTFRDSKNSSYMRIGNNKIYRTKVEKQ